MKRFASLIAALTLVLSCNPIKESEPEKTNFIVVMVDDMGYSDLGCYGGEINTPNIDKLAEQGIRFTQFYNTAKSYPSRASLLTGQYAHQAGIHDSSAPLKNNCITIAQLLKQNGYNTYMTGKWHLGETPAKRGFDKFFGTLGGACNFFDPGFSNYENIHPNKQLSVSPWGIDDSIVEAYRPESDSFYTTDAFTDYAIDYIKASNSEKKPFFLYLAYTAPHFPLQAIESDIEKYKKTYLKGWDIIRKERHRRMTNLGIIDENWQLPAPDSSLRKWDNVNNKELEAQKMAVYAAMIDRIDQNIGKLINTLEQLEIDENTMILFLSDNGACPSTIAYTPDVMPGPKNSYYATGYEWASASCTPFSKYKDWSHEGGISTPLIAYWPKVIRKKGTFIHEPGHIIDIMATLLDISSTNYPSHFEDNKLLPLKGKSFLPLITEQPWQGHQQLFWEFQGGKAIREGKWKLIQEVNTNQWALYDMEADRTETNNLIQEHPDIVQGMLNSWTDWAIYSDVPGMLPFEITADPLIMKSDYFGEEEITLSIKNVMHKTIRVNGNFEDNNKIGFSPHAFNVEVLPGAVKKVKITLAARRKIKFDLLPEITLNGSTTVNYPNGTKRRFNKKIKLYPEDQFLCKASSSEKTIDGNLNDWNNLNIRFSKSYFSEASSSDNSVWFNTCYNDDYVYIGVKILDKKIIADSTKQPWQQDGLEIRIDARPEPARSNHLGTKDFVDHLLVAMSPSEDGIPVILYHPNENLFWYPEVFPPEGMQYACKKSHQGYQAELAVPTTYFSEKQGDDWKAFRLNFIIHDNDGEEQTRITWRPDWRDNNSFIGSGTFFRK